MSARYDDMRRKPSNVTASNYQTMIWRAGIAGEPAGRRRSDTSILMPMSAPAGVTVEGACCALCAEMRRNDPWHVDEAQG